MRDTSCLAIERDVPDLFRCGRALACRHQQSAPVCEPHGLADIIPVPGSKRLLYSIVETDTDDSLVTATLIVEPDRTGDSVSVGRPRRRVPEHAKQVGLPVGSQRSLILAISVSNNKTTLLLVHSDECYPLPV